MKKLIKLILEETYMHSNKRAIFLQDDAVPSHSMSRIMTGVFVTLAACYSGAMKTSRHIACQPKPKSQLPESARAQFHESF